MQRVKRSTAVAVLPSPPAGGTPGYFAQPNPQGGVPATIPGYEWYNNVQEELLAVIEGQGLSASDTDRTQLRQAISKMIQAGQRSVIIGSATFAPAVTGTGKAVYWDSANSRFDLALADGSSKQNCVGIADVPNGNVYAFGDAILFSGLTAGARYYLDPTTAGSITTAAPSTNIVLIGIARNASEIFVDIDTLPSITTPSGTVAHFAMSSAPTGWLKANGAAVSRTTYAALFAAIGTTFGSGDGSTTFNLPDLRGEFIRGFDDGRGADSGRTFGSWQVATAFMGDGDGQNIATPNLNDATHRTVLGFDLDTAPANSTSITVAFPINGGTATVTGMHTVGGASTASDFARTRPRNVALLACIKY